MAGSGHGSRAVKLFAVAALLSLSVLPHPVAAQTEALYNFTLSFSPTGLIEVPLQGSTGKMVITATLTDASTVPPYGALPPGTGVAVLPHHVRLSVKTQGPDLPGWSALLQNQFFDINAGESHSFPINVLLDAKATSPIFVGNLTASIQVEDGSTHVVSGLFTAHTSGVPFFNVQGVASHTFAPRDIFNTNITITNQDLKPRAFVVKEGVNSCGFALGIPTNIIVGPKDGPTKGIESYSVTMQAPAEGFFLLGEQCRVVLDIAPQDNPALVRHVFYNLTLTGIGIEPPLIFNAILLLLAILLLILFLKRRKEKLEEEILGKPQKPWTIPVEKVYLAHLKQKDERAWYVVRHFLMEDEYRSALLWYKSEKKGTKGTRKKERLVLKQEKAYDRWRAGWQKDIAKPLKKADKFEAKLQRKLDRKAKKRLRKDTRKWRKLTRKLKEVQAKQQKRADEKHVKAVKKAQKRGEPVPRAPVVAAPDLPAEPRLRPILLAEHRWHRKADRKRRRMTRKQGNLEVKFERADAKRLRKLESKIRKLARKLDDPDFVEAHPLLRAAQGNAPPGAPKARRAKA